MVEIISGKKQNLWRGPAVLNFFFGGAGVGLYLLRAWLGPDLGSESGLLLVDLLPAALTALGLAAVAVEAGRPFRGAYLFLNVKQSWMSREVIFAALFILLSLVERMAGGAALTLVTSGAGILFVVSQSMILYRSSAVPAWHRPLLPFMFVAASLLHGFGLLLLLSAVGLCHIHSGILAYGFAGIFIAGVIWKAWLYERSLSERPKIAGPIGSMWLMILGVAAAGMLLLLVVSRFVFEDTLTTELVKSGIYAAGGAAIILCGYCRMRRLITGITYLWPVRICETRKKT